MNETQKKTMQILDYTRLSINPTYLIEMVLYFVFLKYAILQDKKERIINIEDIDLSKFFSAQISTENAREFAKISVEKFIKKNQNFFENKAFQ